MQNLKSQITAWLKKRMLDAFVPVVFFGKDHWTTFAYAEYCVVEREGVLQPEKMRCNYRRHRPFAVTGFRSPGDGGKYPTRLKEGIDLPEHDDWDCLQDLEGAGLLVIVSDTVIKPRGKKARECTLADRIHRGPFTNLTCRVRLTDLGVKVASALRVHIAATRRTGEFVVPAALKEEIDRHVASLAD